MRDLDIQSIDNMSTEIRRTLDRYRAGIETPELKDLVRTFENNVKSLMIEMNIKVWKMN